MSESVSIRRRLVWYVLITTVVMSVVTGVGVYRGTTHEADEIFDAALVQTARILDGIMTRQAIEANRHHLEQALERAVSVENRKNRDDEDEELHAYEKKLFFVIRDTAGTVLLNSHFAPDLGSDAPKAGFDELQVNRKNWISLTLKASDDDLWIIVGERSDVREEVTEYIGSALLTPLVFILPIVLFFLWRTLSLALKPLQQAVDEVSEQDINNLKKVTVEGMPLEIEPLLQAINQMVGKLDSAYQREKRFVSDASHELRNPLAALLINIDNALEENNDAEVEESLTSMKQSIARLSHLVSQLLLLSHSENPLSSKELTCVDLRSLCEAVIGSYRDIALARNQRLSLEMSHGDYRIEGVEALLSSLISNLVDNSIKYCNAGCQIKLSCYYEDKDIVICVDDSGEGLDKAMREKVVSRFFRGDSKSVIGAGLGLSITEAIAEIHSATMDLTESELGGLCVRIRFYAQKMG